MFLGQADFSSYFPSYFNILIIDTNTVTSHMLFCILCYATVIPKRNSVFAVEINGFVSHIYGNKFEQRASERSAKKFKVRGTVDL